MPLNESDIQRIEAALPPPDVVDVGGDHPTHSSESQTLSAREALERLQRGEILEDVRVERLTFKGEFVLPVRLKHVTLIQPRFDGVVFREEVTLHGCTVDRPNFGQVSEFHKNLDLTGSTLLRTAIQRIIVKGNFNCEHVHTRGKFSVIGSKFEGEVKLWETRFSGWTEFKGCEINGLADFRSFHAEEGFVILGGVVRGEFWFRGSTVSKKFEANGVRFESLVDFSKAKFHDFCYLENIEQGEKQTFAFANTVGERIRLKTDQLVGRLASEQRGDQEAAMHEYAFLKRAFEAIHHFDQEDWAYYRFKVCQRRARPQSWAKPWTKLMRFLDWAVLDKGCGYCTDPFRAVRTAGVLILLFGVIYALGIAYLPQEVDQHLPFEGTRFGLINRVTVGLYESVAVFISGLNGLSEMAKGPMTWVLMLEALLGTLLWGLFIVSFSRKIIR